MRKFQDFVEIIEILRGPNGCPWDREQTLESLKPYLLEEAYEVMEAMDDGGNNLKGELGDLLLQIVFQSSISKEKNEFTVDDVIDSICEKMIRRHPHVFGDLSNDITTDEVLVNWEEIKSKEKEHEERKSILDGIPKGLPALSRAEKIQKKVSKEGFDWNNIKDVLGKVKEEIIELEDEINLNNYEKMEEELGDLYFSIVNLSRHLKINSELALNKANKKFEKRFRYVEKNCNLKESSLEKMEELWKEAKELENKN